MGKQLCKVQSKQSYPTRTAAIKAALSYSKRRGTPLRVYYHPECKAFHLTRTPLRDNGNRKVSA
jgi:hypothetical protein